MVSLPVATGTVSYPPPQIWEATWSPSDQAVAVAIDSFRAGSTIRTYPLDGDKPTTWFSIDATANLPGLCSGCGGGNTIAQLAGWWADWGIGFWAFSSGAIHGLDSSPLELVHAPGAMPNIIGRTLSNGLPTLAASYGGFLAIVASALNAGRSYGIGKQVEVCQLSSLSCAPVPGASTWEGKDPLHCTQDCALWPVPGKPGSAVSLDPPATHIVSSRSRVSTGAALTSTTTVISMSMGLPPRTPALTQYRDSTDREGWMGPGARLVGLWIAPGVPAHRRLGVGEERL